MTLAVEQEEDGPVTRERLQTDGAGCFLVDILSLPPPTMIITITMHHLHHAVRGTTNEGAVTEDASRPAHTGRSASCLPFDPDDQASGN